MITKIQSTSSEQAEKLIGDFLANHYSGVLGTVSAAGESHGAVVYYLPELDLSLHFVTKEQTQKYKNTQENELVSFVVYDEKSQTSLQIHGTVKVIDDREKKREALHNMTNSSIVLSGALLPPAYKLEAGDYAVLQLVPRSMDLAIYSRTNDGENVYESLQFEPSV